MMDTGSPAPAGSAAPGLAHSLYTRARRTPAAVALVDGDRRLDYAALDAAGAAVARSLHRHGVRPGQAVAVCLPRSWQLVCAMLGILRLGAVVVPLDAQSPPERRHHILADSASVALIHGEAAPDGLPDGVAPLAVSALLGTGPATDAAPPPPFAAPPVSFLFYTSGTTGRPKGVEVRDAGILRLARPGYLRLSPAARYAWLSNPAFDALSFEVWVPLLTGGRCVVLDDETVQTPHLLAAALRRERIDTLFITVALFNAVVDKVPDCFADAGQVLVGGEQLNARLIQRWYRDNAASTTQLHNVYGPTEATTFALCHPVPRDFDAAVVPIGRALPGTEALLVADGDRPAEPGEVAELLLAGEALAAGYRNLPDETARRFVRLPWYDGGHGRYYRSGDLVRRDADGHIEYVGRADRQVKVRGFRIEPGELERQIVAHPAVQQAYVCTRRDAATGVNELLAYLVLRAELSFEDFGRHVAAGLPPYMRPHRVHLVEALPLNANGKVDRAALLGRADPPWRGTEVSGPAATGQQREVLELAGEVLGVAGLRPGDRWLAHGGDSLKALRLRFEVRRRWGCELPQALVLQGDFAQLAAAVAAGRTVDGDGDGDGAPYPAPPAPAGACSAPATAEQQRLWLLQQRTPRSCAYNVGLAFRLRGAVDTAALRGALRRLVARHPALRTAFAATPEGLRQTVAEPYDPWTEPGPAPDGDGWRAVAHRLFATPFDLARPRLLDACWLAQDDGGVLLLHLHHIAVDGWSLNVLFHELSADYAAASRADGGGEREATGGEEASAAAGAPVPTPLDFAVWQADWFRHPAYLSQRAALRAHYDGLDEAAEPLRPIRAGARAEGRLLRTSVDADRRADLDRLGAELGLTRFQLLLSVFAWSLYGVTGRTEPRIAGPVANRPVQEFEGSVGMFANTVLLPLTAAPHEELRTQLTRQGAGLRAVLDRQDVALADVLADREFPADGPPFDFLFVLENTDFTALALPGCDSRPEWLAPSEAKCPLTLSVVERAAGFDCLWEYADGHFDPAEVAALADLFRQGLDKLADGTETTLAELVAPYRRTLPEPGRGPAAEPAFATVAEGFARQVRRMPDAPALVTADGRSLSYAALDAHAAALAAELQDRYPLPPADDRPRCVALHFPPSVEHVVALLALARLNLTIVPLDPAYPPALLRQILDQVAPLCVLLPPGDPAALDAIAADGLPRHVVTLSTAPAPALPPHTGRRSLYTLFTSGSTGTPKGVQVPDRTLCNLLHWQRESGGLAADAVTLQFAPLSFDVSFQEIFGTLCGGGRLHLVRPGLRQDAPALLEHLETAGIERVFMPYVALQLLAEHGVHLGRHPSRLREVVTAGEQLLCTDAIRRWFGKLPGARLFNHYGPTETHVVSALRLDGDPAHWPDRPAIGRPVANAWLRVVDEAGQAVPPDCAGELLIGGPMAAPCYLGDAALDDARFVELTGLGRFYRSGDRARFDRRGLLHYLGRDDQQIKLSGHRLELGQVEAALLRHPGIVNAVVVLDGEHLVGCLQCRAAAPTPEELADHLAPLLPPHVRIARFRRLTALPRTPSGKLDRRRALRAPGEELRPRATAAPVLSDREAQLTELFEAVIGKPIGPEQRFFDAGASSLGLMRFHLRCTAELGLPLTIPDLFEHVTVRRLARFLEGRPAVRRDAAPVAAADEPVAVIGMAVRLPGARDLAAFWDLVRTGGRGIEHFDAAGGLVGARSQMAGLLAFDPEHFGISRQEARLMDPQQRHLLMSCVEALAHAGIADPAGRRVGLVAGCGENTYFQTMLREADPAQLPDGFQLALHHDKDFLATKPAYHLGLSGPALTVQAACASSLAAVHIAAGLLRQGDAEVMLAGGVLVDTLLTDGYRYRPQHIFSKDGHCRPFSDDASGTIGASGVGVVVLKPLRLARRDGDTVYAVITGSALNNDGADKLSYSAPSLAGQREVIRTALRRSGRGAADLGYVEAHGTGTQLGDPVEVGALRQAYGLTESGRCALASVKSQLGHLGAAAGVIGLVRATLAVHHGLIPPNVDFHRLNPQLGPDPAPFYIPTKARPWPAGRPRVAAVSSFGIGGTNAHLVLEAGEPAAPPGAVPCLVLSSSSAAGLRADAARVADYLAARPEAYGHVLRHLQAGRPPRRWRLAAVCADAAEAVAWLRTAAGAEVAPSEASCRAADHPARELADAWLAGRTIHWPAGPAQAPWDFPPPAFELADYDFARAAPATGPAAPGAEARLPEADWLHQPHWTRLRRAATKTTSRAPGLVVLMSATPSAPSAWRPFEAAGRRVVRVSAAASFARLADGGFQVDPADPASLRQLLDALPDAGRAGIDWLHALPLAVDGAVDEETLARARWACLDTPAALLQAVAALPDAPPLRTWWLSHRAQPVEGTVERPELGLLAGVCEVAPQECAVEGHWLDLPGDDPAGWAPELSAVLAEDAAALPRRLALRQGYWWQPTLLPVAAPAPAAPTALPAARGVHLILGGTGGIGSGIAAWLLARTDCRVILLARRPELPAGLAPWADRVTLCEADLAEEAPAAILARLDRHTHRIDGVVHAAGVAAGGLIARRDAAALRQTTAAKLHGALLVEQVVARHRPDFAVYCSSMSALFGGVGQLDYAAANGLLDGFARHRADAAETTVRLGIDWDIWREAGMARHALPTDARHRAHLAVGLDVAEGQRLFARALHLQLPQLLVSTTALEQARGFYAAPSPSPATSTAPTAAVPTSATVNPVDAATAPAAERLAERLCHWLGLDHLDPAASLYDLGADSLTLLDLIDEVKRHFGVDLELSRLSHRVSLTEVLARLAEALPDGPPGADPVAPEVWQEGHGHDLLCLVHPVGGDIQAYRSLVSALDPRLTVCLIADPALHQPDLPAWPLADRARRYHAALQARFPRETWRWRLAGWSFGAWVAVAMAAEAEAAGRPADGLYLLDPPPPGAGRHFRAYDEAQLEAVFAHELGQGGTGAPVGREARAYAERLARCCRANLASMARYEPPRLTETPGHLWLASRPVAGLPAPVSPAEQQRLWQARLPRPAGRYRLDTTHYDIVRPPHVQAVAEAINAALPPVPGTR
ncbi:MULTISPECIES: non-ribosomal peptide synthetase [Streptomyces]|uniref:non-ribosomal peptide synthetase n=1 Tax=Streptomyces TaxID=1883 RepID=UPI0006994001|nr:non-ribosomal peptide synthetase [Streptomyces sp. SID7805]MYU56091.1 non-ribosomal peptide synthetase [Streptomyces sp. SID7805]